jgi:hypothetical protein
LDIGALAGDLAIAETGNMATWVTLSYIGGRQFQILRGSDLEHLIKGNTFSFTISGVRNPDETMKISGSFKFWIGTIDNANGGNLNYDYYGEYSNVSFALMDLASTGIQFLDPTQE